MVRLNIILILLSTLILVQVAPLWQFGKVLSQSQWTEEVPDDSAEDNNSEMKFNFLQTFLPANHTNPLHALCETNVLISIFLSANVPSNHSTDVFPQSYIYLTTEE